MLVQDQIAVDVRSTLAPITVTSTVMCSGLNAQYLGGLQALDFALAGHTHDASQVVSGQFGTARLAAGTALNRSAPISDGTQAVWRAITLADVSDASALGRVLLTQPTQADMRATIDAAKTLHQHDGAHITSGLIQMDRLGGYSGSPTSSYALVPNGPGSSCQWKRLQHTDIGNAVGIGLPPTSGRVTMWSGASTISDAPISAGGGFVGIVTGYGLAVADDSFYINGVKMPKAPSTGLLYGLRANGAGATAWETITAGGATPPTTPANAVYVWVVNAGATGGDWYQLTGDNVYVA